MVFIHRSDLAGAVDQVTDENSVDPKAVSRLHEAVKEAGGPTEAARLSGVPLSSLRTYLKGRELRRPALVALASAARVSIEWLATGRGPMRTDEGGPVASFDAGSTGDPAKSVPAGYVALPRYNISASAGGGSSLVDHPQVVEYLAFEQDFLRRRLQRHPQDLGLIEARGDSMEPTVRDGDVLTVDLRPGQPIESGLLYVVRAGDTILVKRVEVRVRDIILHSDNVRYGPESFRREEIEQIHIIGRVLLITSSPR